MKNWPLRIKITILVGIVIAFASFALTANAIISADQYYGNYIEAGMIYEDIPQSIKGLPDAEEHAIEIPVQDGIKSITRRFSIRSVGVMVLISGISLILAYGITGKVLRPLGELTEAIHNINQENLREHMELPDAAGEVQQLMNSFNGMLGRLEESFELQRQFSSNAAHELKTPLTVMKTSLQVLEMEDNPSKKDYQDFMEDTRESLERLIRTVDNLLALTVDTNGEEPVEVPIDELFNKILQEFDVRAAEMSVSLTAENSGEMVMCNATLIYRLIYNLTENAIKYNRPEGSVHIQLVREQGRRGIKITDSGIGMNEDTLKHVCEPFYRADESRSQMIPGAGLGLSIVKLISERIGGTLEIISRPNVGTNVCFWFPENI